MTATALIEQTVTVAGKPIFFAEAGEGPSVVMLRGGGPGASGVSNYSRNIDALAEHFRVLMPDMPGYGCSAKDVDPSDPFGYLADVIRRLLDELGLATAHLVGNSYGGAAALRLALDTPRRVDKLVLMERSAVVFIHPAELPGPSVPGIPSFAADFLLDTTGPAYLLVSNGIQAHYPDIRFILSHAGGFLPYASRRLAVTIALDTGRSPADVLDDFAGFYFDTALSSSPAALPTLLAFAKPGQSPSGPIGRLPRPPPASCSRPGWRPIRVSTRRPAPPLTAPTRWRSSPGSALRRNRFRNHRRSESATSSSDRACVASSG